MGRKALYAADPDAVYVSVYCNAASHADEPWRIATYSPVVELGPGHWAEQIGKYESPESDTLIPIRGSTRAYLAGDRPVSKEESRANPDALEQGDSRTRFGLTCEQCGLSVTARSEKAFPIFDVLAAAGIKEISLAALGKRLAAR